MAADLIHLSTALSGQIRILPTSSVDRCGIPLTEMQRDVLRGKRFTKAELFQTLLIGTVCTPHEPAGPTRGGVFGFIMQPDALTLLCDDSYAECLVEYAANNGTWHRPAVPSFFCVLLEELIEHDLEALDALSRDILALEKKVQNGRLEHFSEKFSALHRRMLHFDRYYSFLIDLTGKLAEWPSFDPTDQLALERFLGRCERLNGETKMLRDNLTQLRQERQAQIELQQNRTMQILTVVTVIFMPLTLIVGWYGMNFTGMPELKWGLGYPLVILLSIASVLLTIWICKRRHFF